MIVDLAHRITSDGLFDLEVANGDLKISQGLESPLLVSLFSDRRAFEDEVADPERRRGWIGDDLLPAVDDRFGSGLWLYEQARLTPDIQQSVRYEAESALRWLTEDNIVATATAQISSDPARRRMTLDVTLGLPTGGDTRQSYVLADATVTGTLRDR